MKISFLKFKFLTKIQAIMSVFFLSSDALAASAYPFLSRALAFVSSLIWFIYCLAVLILLLKYIQDPQNANKKSIMITERATTAPVIL